MSRPSARTAPWSTVSRAERVESWLQISSRLREEISFKPSFPGLITMHPSRRGAIRALWALFLVVVGASAQTQGAGSNSASDEFTFLAYGDSRAGNGCEGNAVHIGLVKRMAAEPAQFVFNTGDMVTGYDKSTNWVQRGDCKADASQGSLKEIIAPLQNKPPAPGLPTFYFPVVGNHDDNWNDGWYPDKFGNGFCDVFDPKPLVPNHTQNRAYFADWRHSNIRHFSNAEFYALACAKTPEASAVYPNYMYYSFDFMHSHFVVLRVNTDYYNLVECPGGCGDEADYDKYYYRHQLDWLRYDLREASDKASTQSIFVLLHAPLITSSWGHAANTSWPTLLQEFSRNPKVKLVISGHNHVYERSYPVFASPDNPAGMRDDRRGTVYLVTGGGGSAVHGFNSLGSLTAKATTDFHYLRIKVKGSSVQVQAIGLDGMTVDTFSR
jgi:Calcineurin-like phosphoesterase